MFTPEFSNPKTGEVVLVASHNLESDEGRALSVAFNRARLEFGKVHAPGDSAFRLIYDIRGQNRADDITNSVQQALSPLCRVEFKR